MMKRYLLSIILGILSFANYSYGQIELGFSAASGDVNGTVDVDVTVSGFNNIGGLQFTGEWDSLVMTFNSVVSTNPDLPALTPGDISGPEGAAVDEGQFTVAFIIPSLDANLDDGSVLFTLRFDLVGDECDKTDFEIANDPTMIDAFDGNLEPIAVTATSEETMINGTDCGGTGGGDLLTVTAGTVNAAEGSQFCVPITVDNFNAVQSGSGIITWDSDVISYDMIDNIGLLGLDNGDLNETNTANGELKFVWFNDLDPSNPITLPNGTKIFDICFTAIGDVDDVSPITFVDDGAPVFEFADDDGTAYPQTLVDGEVTIVGEVVPPFIINISDVTVNQDDGTGCVDVSVANFTNILTMEYTISWDPSIIGNGVASDFNLIALNANSFFFNNTAGSATFSWNGNSGTTIPDNTVIYKLCFDLLGDCDESSPVEILNNTIEVTEFDGGVTTVLDNINVSQGSILIDCPPMDGCNGLAISSISNACVGADNGSVTINPGTACTFSWANSSGTEIATTQNLTNVGVGVYILTATCNGTVCSTITAEVNEIPGPTISGMVTNAECGGQGAIDIVVTGGSGNYNYSWNPSQPNSPNIANLMAGDYDLTVTDTESGCTSTSSFEVLNIETDLTLGGANINDESCVEEDGSIMLSVSGGCMPYTYNWSNNDIGNTPNAVNLAAGTYLVTVTDDNSNSVMGSYTVDGFTPIELDGIPNISPENQEMGDGAITIELMGGTAPYSYNWSGPTSNLPDNKTITGLSAGDYTVAVTDALGCTAIFGPFSVPNIDEPMDEPEFGDIQAVDVINGFGVICNGDATGTISGSLTNGMGPFTLTLSGDKDSSFVKEGLGTFVFDNLAAGVYTIEATNSFGTDTSVEIEITEPDAILYAIDKGCDEEEQCDGFIDLNASGGFGNLTYTWSDPDLSGDSADDLCEGNYIVTVMDENGCQKMESIDIVSCNPSVPTGCYEVRNVITPNGDGMNETFAITCINDFPATLEIYDRWGTLVFNQDVYDGQWSGISNSGDELIEGGYMYVLVIDFGQGNRQVMKGAITLLRD